MEKNFTKWEIMAILDRAIEREKEYRDNFIKQNGRYVDAVTLDRFAQRIIAIGDLYSDFK